MWRNCYAAPNRDHAPRPRLRAPMQIRQSVTLSPTAGGFRLPSSFAYSYRRLHKIQRAGLRIADGSFSPVYDYYLNYVEASTALTSESMRPFLRGRGVGKGEVEPISDCLRRYRRGPPSGSHIIQVRRKMDNASRNYDGVRTNHTVIRNLSKQTIIDQEDLIDARKEWSLV